MKTTCKRCDGSGHVRCGKQREAYFHYEIKPLLLIKHCPDCKGTGKIHTCITCGGRGQPFENGCPECHTRSD